MRNNTLKACLMASTLICGVAGMTAVVAPAAMAQSYTTGAVGGTVLDQTGAPVAGATVVLVNTARGTTRSVSTNNDGSFYAGLLPVGNYSVTIGAAGYQSISDDSVRVNVGGSSDYSFVLAGGSSTADVITVTGSAIAANSFQMTETGLTIDIDEVFAQIPVGRDITSLTLLAPGAIAADTAFGGASISGSSAGENVFYINGMNITDFRNFLGASTVPFQFYQQVEVKTGGYQAEFGRSTGGVTNAVTRSGSNEFHGGFSAYYSPDELRSDSPDTFFSANRFDQRTSTDVNFYASGPIIPDRLFFYALYSPRFTESINLSESGSLTIDRSDDPFWGVKLDANLFEGHTLGITAFSDARSTTREVYSVATVGADSYSGLTSNGETNFFAGGDVYIGNYTGALTDWLTLSVTYGTQTFNQTTSGTTDANPIIIDARPAGPTITLGNWAGAVVSFGEDSRELFRADLDIYAQFMGDHHIRVGFDREELTAVDQSQYSGGIYYRYEDVATCEGHGGAVGAECVRLRVYESGGEFTTIQTAMYIQDSWEVTDQLTVNLGLRNETFDNRNADGDTFTEMTDQLAPRLGFGYDVFNDGSFEVYGFWGRYFLPVAANTNIRMAGGELFTEAYHTFGSVGAGDVPTAVSAVPFDSTIFGDGTVADTRSTTDQNLDPMYKDEIILGARWAFNDLWDFGLSYTHRELGVTLEDVAIDAAVNAYCTANAIAGCGAIWSGFHQYVLTNPGEDMLVYLPDLPGGAANVSLSAADLGYPEATNTYDALEFTFDRAFENGFDLHGSWTISNSEGNYEGPVKSDNGQDDAGITTAFDQPGLTDGSDGPLPNDRTHKIKVWGHYEVNDVFSVGANMAITSPRSFGCIGVHPTDFFASLYGGESWFCDGVATPRGSLLESDWTYTVDMNFVYRPTHLPFGGEPVFRVDVFNIFDADAVTDIYEVGEETLGVAEPSYGLPSGYQAPRSVRIGMSWDF